MTKGALVSRNANRKIVPDSDDEGSDITEVTPSHVEAIVAGVLTDFTWRIAVINLTV